MRPDGQIPDVLAVVTALAMLMFSADVAHMVGPYLTIIMASAIGASWTVKRRDITTRASAMWFFVRVCGAAVLLTGFVSALISGMHADLNERSLMVPVAFGLGAIGSDWKLVGAAIGRKLLDMIELLFRRGGGS